MMTPEDRATALQAAMAKNCRRWREEAAWLWDDDISEMIVVAFRDAWDAGYSVAREYPASGENAPDARDLAGS